MPGWRNSLIYITVIIIIIITINTLAVIWGTVASLFYTTQANSPLDLCHDGDDGDGDLGGGGDDGDDGEWWW